MKKWKSNLTKAAVSLCLLAVAPNSAQAGSCDPCDPCANPCDMCCFGGFDIGADFIWWKPCVSNLDYAAEVSLSGTAYGVQYHNVCPEWEPGFRIWIGKDDLLCDCDFGFVASYTWIKSKENRELAAGSGNTIVSTYTHEGLDAGDFTAAVAHWDTTYQSFDVLMTHRCCCGDCFEFTPFFGVEGLFINQHLDTLFTNTGIEGATRFESNFSGAGLKAGTNFEWQVTDCIRLFSLASASIVVGDQDGTNFSSYRQTVTQSVTTNDSNCCEIVPGYHIAAGFIYDTCMCGMDLSFHIGYEFIEWWNVTNPRIFTSDSLSNGIANSTSPTTSTFGFHGLLAGLDLSF